MNFTTQDILMIIRDVVAGIVLIITAWNVTKTKVETKTIAQRVGNIEHSVNSAAERSLARIETLMQEVAELKAAALKRRGKVL